MFTVCNVSSTTTETPCVPSIEHTVKCEKNGEYKVINPQNCAEFYWCKNNTLLVADPQSCAAGSAFNESSGDCDIFRHKVENCLPLKCPTTTVIPTTLSTAPTTGTTFSTTDLTQSTSESSTSTTDSTPLSTWSYSGSSSITTSKTESTSESAASTIDNTEPHTNRSTVSDSTTDNVYTTQSASSRVTNVPSTDFHSTVTADNPIDLTTTAQSQSSSVDSSRRNAGLGLTTTTSPTIRTAGSLSTTFSSHSGSSSDGPINSTAVDIEALTATTKNIGQQNQQNADDTPTDSGSVAGAITGGVLGFAVLCLLIFLVVRWYKRKTHGNYR